MNKKIDNVSIKSNCVPLECIKIIEPNNTVEEVNNIIGVKGKLIDEKNEIYEYSLNDGTILLKYFYGNSADIVSSYDKDKILNEKVDLSNLKELKLLVDSGIYYDEFKVKIGNIDGILIEKNDKYRKYIWISEKNGSVIASFRIEDNLCIEFTGYSN